METFQSVIVENVSEYLTTAKSYIKKNKWAKYVGILGGCYLFRKLWWYIYRKYYNLPPGPNGLPFVGCIPEILLKLGPKYASYGPICLFPSVGTHIIMLNNSKLTKQLYTRKEFFGRNDYSNAIHRHSLFDVGESKTYPI